MECHKQAKETGRHAFRLILGNGPVFQPVSCRWHGPGLGSVCIKFQSGSEESINGHDLANYLLALHPNYKCEII